MRAQIQAPIGTRACVCAVYSCSSCLLVALAGKRVRARQTYSSLHRVHTLSSNVAHPDDPVVQVPDGELAAGERLR